MTDETILEYDGVTKQFGGLTAIDDLHLSIPRSTITGIIGPNGAGKSTLFNLTTGFLKPTTGEIRLDGTRIDGKQPFQIAAQGIGRSFQTPKVFNGMTVAENLAFAARDQDGELVRKVLNPLSNYQETEQDVTRRANEVLEFLELEHLAEEYARGLSGGQRKLLELGRVLMTDPDVILLDEPVAGVNPVLQEQIIEHIHELHADDRTIVLIEHDMDVIMDHCERVVVMADGAKLSAGTPAVIQDDDRVIDAYLGGETV